MPTWRTHHLARLRDRRCNHSAEDFATALDGLYRPEHVTGLRLCLGCGTPTMRRSPTLTG